MPQITAPRSKRAQKYGNDERGRHADQETNRQRSVSFSRRHLGAAANTEPGHRMAGPARPSLRSPSPVKRNPDNFYTFSRDEQICIRVHELRMDVFSLAVKFPQDASTLQRILEKRDISNETCRYIECLMIPERTGSQFWYDALGGPGLVSIVAALIGRALQQHVLGALFFGASGEQLAELESNEQRQDFKDSYDRIRSRAEICKAIEQETPARESLSAQCHIAASILRLLAPLIDLDERRLAQHALRELFYIVKKAAELNHTMRQDADILWQWTDIWKDTRYNPATAEASNMHRVFETTSYEGPRGGGAKLREGCEEKPDPIVRLVVFPGLTAWRRIEEDGHVVGDRARRIMKNTALIEWSRQRRRTAVVGTRYHMRAVAEHNTAQFEKDEAGAVNLWDLVYRD